jgi:hypothetical protein
MLRDQHISRPLALSRSKYMILIENNRANGSNREYYGTVYLEYMRTVRKSNRPYLV